MTDALQKILNVLNSEVKDSQNETLLLAMKELGLAIQDNEDQHTVDMIESNDLSYEKGYEDGYENGKEEGFDEACDKIKDGEYAS